MSEQQIEHGNGLVTVHVDPPLRLRRDCQLVTPLKRRDVRAGTFAPGSFFNAVHRTTLPLASLGILIWFFKVGTILLQLVYNW
jgi:hypothetical protein